MGQGSLLSIVDQVDNFSYGRIENHYVLSTHDGRADIGYLSNDVTRLLEEAGSFVIDHKEKRVQIAEIYDTLEKRNTLFASVAAKWRKYPSFEKSLDKGWRNELYTIYYPQRTPYILVERAFSVLIGVATYGVHINGYVESKSPRGEIKLWIPRRAQTKPTYPGMCDNTVAGGIGYPYGIEETVLKECNEEAGLSEEFVVPRLKGAGVLSYLYQPKGPLGPVQPEVEYVFDLKFDDETTVIPSPQDGEAEDFRLMDVEEVKELLFNGEFKPNCGLIIIDFLIRHGLILPWDIPEYHELVTRSHRLIPFPTM